MKKIIMVLSAVVLVAGCASDKYCMPEAKVETQGDCTLFNGISGDDCNAHVPHKTVEFESSKSE